MGATIPLRNIVRETENVFLIRVIPLQRQLDHNLVFLRDHVHDGRVQRVLGFAQMLDKGCNPALILEAILLAGLLFEQRDAQAGVEKGQLA